jgi:hypothetical protein
MPRLRDRMQNFAMDWAQVALRSVLRQGFSGEFLALRQGSYRRRRIQDATSQDRSNYEDKAAWFCFKRQFVLVTTLSSAFVRFA